MKIFFLLLCVLFSFYGCSEEDEMKYPIQLTRGYDDLLSFSCIWDKPLHAAFTDLAEYNNSFYCCFRESNAHVPSNESEYGKIRILHSEDGETWTSVALIEDPERDLRDPKLSVTPDNRLMLLMGASKLDRELKFSSTMVAFATNQNTSELFFNAPSDINVNLNNHWIWRITWNDGWAYGVAYDCNPISQGVPYLVKSKDGVNYDVISPLSKIGPSNEADILFIDDKMMIVIRNNSNNGYIGFSSSPYSNWSWTHLNFRIHAPRIIKIDGELFVTGRGNTGCNMLYYIEKNKPKLTPIYIFPSSGDSSYPGAILVKDELWVSYYTTLIDRTSIYFTRISVPKLFERAEISR